MIDGVFKAADHGSPGNFPRYPDNKDLTDFLVQYVFRWNTGVRTGKNRVDGALILNHGPQIYINRIADTGSLTLEKPFVPVQDLFQYF